MKRKTRPYHERVVTDEHSLRSACSIHEYWDQAAAFGRAQIGSGPEVVIWLDAYRYLVDHVQRPDRRRKYAAGRDTSA